MPANRRTTRKAPGEGAKGVNSPGGRRSERRQALIDIAAELFAERGFRSTTVREIGDAAGVLSGSLYYHFDSKETIVDEILSTYLTSLLASYEEITARAQSPADTLSDLVTAAFESLGPHRAAITVIQNERNYLAQFPRFAYLADAERKIREIWTDVLARGMADGSFRRDLDPPVVYRFLRDSVWVSVRWFDPSGDLGADQLAAQYLHLVMDGLRNPA